MTNASEAKQKPLQAKGKGVKGEAMRLRLLGAARLHFLKDGFAGASIHHIAQAAGVHKSHVYHYFPHKEALWLAVKQQILEEVLGVLTPPHFPDESVEQFVRAFVRYRFHVYAQSPDLVRMLSWQRLEPDHLHLKSPREMIEGNARACLDALKSKGLLYEKMEIDQALVLLLHLPPSLFLDAADPTHHTQKQREAFESLLVRCLTRGLGVG
ncbi:MAG: TetR/AcrR family transcriptional regulator [Holosporales bacterium]